MSLSNTTLRCVRQALLLIAIVVALMWAGQVSVRSQEATPTAASSDRGLPPGVTLEILAYGVAPAEPGLPVDVTLYRLTLEPGALYTLDGGDPTLSLTYVETGTLTLRLNAAVTLQRAEDPEGLFTEQTVEVAARETAVLERGDSVLLPPRIEGEFQNLGEDSLSVLVAQYLQSDAGGE
jgi:hypothetical protein